MKQKIRLGNSYALTKHKLKQSKLQYFSLLAVGMIMCLYAVKQVSAQEAEPAATAVADIKPLQIGDTIPESLWHLPLQVVNHPEGKDTISLDDYKDSELLILYFWGYSCSGCIKSINELETLRKALGDSNLAVLPIHILPYQLAEEKKMEYIGKTVAVNSWSVPTVIKDSALHSVFSRYLSDWGDVWILNGRLLAVPKHGYLSAETIEAVINDGFIDFENRKNVPVINPYQKLLTAGNGEGTILRTTENSVVTSYIPNQRRMYLRFEWHQDTTYLYTWNVSLPELLYQAYASEIMPLLDKESGILWQSQNITDSQLRWEVRSSANALERVAEREKWNNANRYGYQLRVPGKLSQNEALRIMQRDIADWCKVRFGVELSIMDYGHHKYAVLEKTDSISAQRLTAVEGMERSLGHTDNFYRFFCVPFEMFVRNVSRSLRLCQNLQLTANGVINRTGIDGDKAVTFQLSRANMDSGDVRFLHKELVSYGLQLSVRSGAAPMLLVRSSIH